MSRPVLRALAGAALALAAICPAVASAQSSPAPALRVHAIFTGDSAPRSTFHVGEALFVDVSNAGRRKLAQACFSPAPIARPACSAAHIAAPAQVGSVTITATLDDGTKLSKVISSVAPATHVGRSRAVPATITCQDVTLFGNYDRRRHRSRDPFETMRRGTQVGLYNVIAPGKIFMWDYATNRGGFATQSCAKAAA